MKHRERQLIMLSSVLTIILTCVIGAILWQRQDAVSAGQADALAEAAPVAIAQAQCTPTPDSQAEKIADNFATSAPKPRITHIQRDISRKLRIDAEAVEPSALTMQTAKSLPIPYDYKALPDLLFQDKESKREVIALDFDRYDTYNARGECILVEPGRVCYARYASKEERSHYAQVTDYLHTRKPKGKYLYESQAQLAQELSFLGREKAAQQAKEYTLAMQPEAFPFTVESVDIAAVTWAQWDAFNKTLYEDQYTKFSSIPREGEQDYGGDGLYFVTLRFNYQDIPVYMGHSDLEGYISSFRTTSRVQYANGMLAQVLVSASGVIHYDASNACTFALAQDVPVLSLEQAVESMATEYKEFDLVMYDENTRLTIDRVYLTYVRVFFVEGGAEWTNWQPMWCFLDEKVEGGSKDGQPYGLYLDAITGKSYLTM